MRNLLVWSVLAVCSVSAVFSPAARAADEDKYAEHLLPPETLLFFSIPSVPDLLEQCKDSTVGQMWVEPKLQPFIGSLKNKIEEAFKEHVESELGVSLGDLIDLPQGEFTVALIEKPARKLSVVLMIDCTDNEDTLDKLLEKLDQALTKNDAEHSTQTIADIEVHSYKLANAGGGPVNTLSYCTDEGYVFFATEVAALKSVLERWSGDNENTLAKADVFAYIQDKCKSGDDEPVVKWYVDPISLVKAALNMGNNPQQAAIAAAMMPVLGLDKLKGLGGGSHLGVEGFEGLTKAFVYVEQPPTGVLGVFQFPAIEQRPAKWIPSDTASYFSLNWNVEEAYNAIESLVDSLQGPGSVAKVVDALATQEDGPHMHLKKDLVDQLSGRIDVVVQAPKIGGDEPPVPSFALALGVKDAAQMKNTIAKAVESDKFSGTTREVEGQTVYEMPTPQGNPISFSVAADAIVLASTAELMDRIVKGQSRGSLADSDDYAKVSKAFPKKTSIISFQRSDTQQLQSLYDMLKTKDPDETVGVDFTKLPDFSVLKKYLRPSGSYAVPDKKGALFVGFSLRAE